jgi:voltage-gated potassium channel
MGSRKRVLTALIIFMIVFLIGVAGFKILGGRAWSVLDSVYMTAITIGTIGYGETHDLSANPAARTFTRPSSFAWDDRLRVSSITLSSSKELKNIPGDEKWKHRAPERHYRLRSDETAMASSRLVRPKPLSSSRPDRALIDKLAALDPSSMSGRRGRGQRPRKADRKGQGHRLPAERRANLFVTISARSLNPWA